MRWDLIVEERIRAAMDEGAFDQLLGKGQPLTLCSDAVVDNHWQLAYHVMQNAGIAPQWIELDREIREQVQQAREALSSSLATFAESEPARSHAIERFRREVADANRMIKQFNLLIPLYRFGRSLIDAEREISLISVVEEGESS
jgi:hypothetical protein